MGSEMCIRDRHIYHTVRSMLTETKRPQQLLLKSSSESQTIENPVKALLQLGLHLVVVLLLHLSPLEVLVAVRAQVQQSSKILQQRLAQHPQPQLLTVVPVARPLQAVVPLPPAAVPVAAVDQAVVPLDLVDRLDHQDLVDRLDLVDHQVVEDTTAADTN